MLSVYLCRSPAHLVAFVGGIGGIRDASRELVIGESKSREESAAAVEKRNELRKRETHKREEEEEEEEETKDRVGRSSGRGRGVRQSVGGRERKRKRNDEEDRASLGRAIKRRAGRKQLLLDRE
ncbi:transcriptional regulator ATRX-like [Pogonomyrmex barbatus]|uniref:Transcriptional regulator ATRX-like n=1 Tax=Pogonomyrmex barbatus TaxID=144034 RepID=A0A6I9WDZ9_9HYME|nr:transcriptional regulator ATRX-like [Pogonomyrmex barbatus]